MHMSNSYISCRCPACWRSSHPTQNYFRFPLPLYGQSKGFSSGFQKMARMAKKKLAWNGDLRHKDTIWYQIISLWCKKCYCISISNVFTPAAIFLVGLVSIWMYQRHSIWKGESWMENQMGGEYGKIDYRGAFTRWFLLTDYHPRKDTKLS